jgi:hypothetical protein
MISQDYGSRRLLAHIYEFPYAASTSAWGLVKLPPSVFRQQKDLLMTRHLGMQKEVGADLFKDDLHVISYFCKDVLAGGLVSVSLAPLCENNEIVGLMGPAIKVDDGHG